MRSSALSTSGRRGIGAECHLTKNDVQVITTFHPEQNDHTMTLVYKVYNLCTARRVKEGACLEVEVTEVSSKIILHMMIIWQE